MGLGLIGEFEVKGAESGGFKLRPGGLKFRVQGSRMPYTCEGVWGWLGF